MRNYVRFISDYILDATTLWGFSKYNVLLWIEACYYGLFPSSRAPYDLPPYKE